MGVGGCPWRVPSVRRASRGSWVGAVKNDRNFSGGYACGPASSIGPIGGSRPGKQAQGGGSLSNPRHCRVQSVSNPLPGPVISRVLGPCVPAKTTGTRAMDRVWMVRLYCCCTCRAHNATVVCAYSSCLSFLSVHPCPLLSFVTGPCQPARPCAYYERVNHRHRFTMAWAIMRATTEQDQIRTLETLRGTFDTLAAAEAQAWQLDCDAYDSADADTSYSVVWSYDCFK